MPTVDSEEFEQIPWSALVAEHDDGLDRRVYMVVGVVGVLVAVVFGIRLLGGASGQPTPPVTLPPQVATDTTEATTTTRVVVSEADLMADTPDTADAADALRVAALAEWFVTDYFTRDGSPETVRSLRSMMSPIADELDLPHDAGPPTSYVEWARTTGLRYMDPLEVEVEVTFRTITDPGTGFERDPVRAVVVTLTLEEGLAGVTGPPVAVAVPRLEG